MIVRIYLKDFHGKDGCIRCTLKDDASIGRDYEDFLMGRGQSVKSYSNDIEGGSIVLDFRQVAAIKFSDLE